MYSADFATTIRSIDFNETLSNVKSNKKAFKQVISKLWLNIKSHFISGSFLELKTMMFLKRTSLEKCHANYCPKTKAHWNCSRIKYVMISIWDELWFIGNDSPSQPPLLLLPGKLSEWKTETFYLVKKSRSQSTASKR